MGESAGTYTIGALARRTGLSVKTIRFYGQRGIVPTTRSPAGYRLYDEEARARLELVATLRQLGIDLRSIRRVLERETSLREVAVAHAEALGTQIRALRLRQAVLRTVALRPPENQEVQLVHRLARLSEEERHRIVTDFLDEVFGGLSVDPAFEAGMRSALPDLPDEPSPAQVEAWVELAEMVAEPDFRRRIRGMAEEASRTRATGEAPPDREAAFRTAGVVTAEAGAALAGGVDPASPAADERLGRIVVAFAAAGGQEDTPAFRARLLEQLVAGTDARAERYWQLLAVINGWPPVPTAVPAFEWVIAALRARA